jgi:hypothetical protein
MGFHTDGKVPVFLYGVDSDGNLKSPDVQTIEGNDALSVSQINRDGYVVSFQQQNITSTAGYMIVKLAAGGSWPHPAGMSHIDIQNVHVNIDPSNTYVGDIDVGFLSNVDATDGDLNKFYTWHFDRAAAVIDTSYELKVHFDSSNWFGPTDANDATWQTDVAITGPDGNTYTSADGDIVIKVNVSAGAIDISFTIEYIAV